YWTHDRRRNPAARSAPGDRYHRRAHDPRHRAPTRPGPGPSRAATTVRPAAPACPPLLELDLGDLVRLRAAGRRHLNGVADGLADQRARQRRGDREALGLDVRLVLADDLVGALLVGVLVDEGDGRAELDHLARELGNVDDLGARDLVLEL